MPTKTTTKKNVKATRPDPKAKGGAILDARKRALEDERLRVMRIIDPLTLRVTALESNVLELLDRLPAPEPEHWVPKAGDYVKAKVGGKAVYRIERINGPDDRALWYDGRLYPNNQSVEQYRPATQDEIDAHLKAEAIKKQEAEWAAITELQEGDACAELSKRQLQELKDILCADGIFPEGGPTVHYERGTALSGSWRKSEHPKWNWLPYPEFLRRAKGTSARLEAEAKPIPFGTRVKVKGADSDGIYWYASGDKHHVVCDFGGLLIVPRNEITVIPTKP